MRSTLILAGLALGAATTSAMAQQAAAPAAAATEPQPACRANITKGARNALVALQAAVVAKNNAAIPGLVTAAQAVAKSGDDKCFIAQMQLQVAVDTNDLKAAAAAVDAQLASGSVAPADLATKYDTLGRMQYAAGNYAEASTTLERAAQLAPTSGNPLVVLAETRIKQNRTPDGLALFQKAIATEIAAGRKPDEKWYRRAVSVAYDAKSPLTSTLSRDWLAAYPSQKNWRDSLAIYGQQSGLDDAALLDLFRLARLNKALDGESDYGRYAEVTLARGYAGEAKAVLEEGFAASEIDRNKSIFKTFYANATAKAAGDRASLDGQVKSAEAAATAKPLMSLGEAYYGYGDYAKAAAMYRSALSRSGVDANLANLRLGMALAASGDKSGAKAALDLVTGTRAEIARFWLTWLASRP